MIVAAIAMAPTANADEISTGGKRLAKALDAMDVERLWLAKHYVNWETGAALDKPVVDGKSHTHCSAFAAARPVSVHRLVVDLTNIVPRKKYENGGLRHG